MLEHHCTGGGIQCSTSRVELDFLVLYLLFLCQSVATVLREITLNKKCQMVDLICIEVSKG